ncbi:MAG: NifU family protein [Rhodobacterales bacterium]|nr:NifU family protein [Rhodobacterales bacterium]
MSDTVARRRIRAQASSHDPVLMRFVLDAPVQAGQSVSFDRSGNAAPLARALFAINGVKGVQVTGETILVTRTSDHDWQTLKAPVAAAIRQVLDSTDQPLGEAAAPSPAMEADEALLVAVREMLDTKANPSIAGHGGHISVESVEDGIVRLRMSGGCQGCAASAVTLRRGVETMLRAALPAIREIVDVTDHASGQNPYFRGETGQSPIFTRPVPANSIAWEDGELSIDPEYLAPRLGLKPRDLQAGLSRGEIVIETSDGPPPKGMRVTVRSGQRAWAADVMPDGTAQEVPPPRVPSAAEHAPSLPDRVRAYLEDLPAEDLPVTYGRLARGLGMYAPGSIRRITNALETTMREDFEADRPFVAARAVGRGSDNLPGKGFFECARTLGRDLRSDETEQAFHHDQLTKGLKAR